MAADPKKLQDLGTVQRAHPQWNITDIAYAPNGGIWAVGSDGGVFSLDSSGGMAGTVAPFYGSYAGHPEWGAGTTNRKFVSIEATGQGYQLTTSNSEVYGKGGEFTPPAPPSPSSTPAPTVDKTGVTQVTDTSPGAGSDVSGTAAIHAIFDPLGLGDFAEQALTAMHDPANAGADANYIATVWLPKQDFYTKMFPEIAQAQAQAKADGGKTAIPTAKQIVDYRQAAQQMVAQGLLPPELASNDNIGKLIVGGTSISEFENRVMKGWAAIQTAPDDLAAFLSYHPSLDASHAVGVLLDPTLGDVAAQNAITQAQIGGAATRSGFGSITAGQATALQQAGQGSQTQFTQAALQNPLTQNLAGEIGGVTKDTQLQAIAGNAQAQQAITNRQRSRQGLFEGGGGAAGGSGGGTGLGGQ